MNNAILRGDGKRNRIKGDNVYNGNHLVYE